VDDENKTYKVFEYKQEFKLSKCIDDVPLRCIIGGIK